MKEPQGDSTVALSKQTHQMPDWQCGVFCPATFNDDFWSSSLQSLNIKSPFPRAMESQKTWGHFPASCLSYSNFTFQWKLPCVLSPATAIIPYLHNNMHDLDFAECPLGYAAFYFIPDFSHTLWIDKLPMASDLFSLEYLVAWKSSPIAA